MIRLSRWAVVPFRVVVAESTAIRQAGGGRAQSVSDGVGRYPSLTLRALGSEQLLVAEHLHVFRRVRTGDVAAAHRVAVGERVQAREDVLQPKRAADVGVWADVARSSP